MDESSRKLGQVFAQTVERVKACSSPVFVKKNSSESLLIYRKDSTTLTCAVDSTGQLNSFVLSQPVNDDTVATIDSSGSMSLHLLTTDQVFNVNAFTHPEVFNSVLEEFENVQTDQEKALR